MHDTTGAALQESDHILAGGRAEKNGDISDLRDLGLILYNEIPVT